MTVALIDGDIVAYRCAASCLPSKKKADTLGVSLETLEEEPLYVAIGRCDELINRILATTNAEHYKIFLSGENNWRKKIFPEYKAHRESKPKPPHLEDCKNFLKKEWNAIECVNHEADDGIGIHFTPDSIICSIDKDMLTLPGTHFNFVKDEFTEISEEEAEYNFWYLMLVGDSSDGIKGVDGIGPVKARRLLNNYNPNEWKSVVEDLYNDNIRFELTKRLLRIVRSTEELKAIETAISQSQGETPAETSSAEDFSPFQTINS